MRGQYNSQAEAERMLVGRVNWRVQPVMICQANTLYSPIYDGSGVEHDLRFRHGMSSTDILPDVVSAYKRSWAVEVATKTFPATTSGEINRTKFQD